MADGGRSFNVTKGTRVRAEWLQARLVGLAGVQVKAEASPREIVGTVTHVRGDRPEGPTRVMIWIRPDDGSPEVAVEPGRITEILP